MNKQLFEWVDRQQLSMLAMTTKVRMKKHFAFSRCGDGEFDAILGEPGANCDGHKYYKDLGEALGEALMEWNRTGFDNYYMGIHYGARNGEGTFNWLTNHGFTQDKKFCDNSVFHYAFVNRNLENFYVALLDKKVIVVGPQILQKQERIPVEKYIEVDDTDSWHDRQRVFDELLSSDLEDRIVLFCSGPPTPVFIHDQLMTCEPMGTSQALNLKQLLSILAVRSTRTLASKRVRFIKK